MEVASITGHKDIRMLRTYTHLQTNNLVKKIDGTGNIIKMIDSPRNFDTIICLKTYIKNDTKKTYQK